MNELLATCCTINAPEASDAAISYYHIGNIIWILSEGLSLIVPLLFLYKGFCKKIEEFSSKIFKNYIFSALFFSYIFFILYILTKFPLDFISSYLVEKKFNLINQTFDLWLLGYIKEFGVEVLSTGLVASIFLILFKKYQKKWWLISSLILSAFLFFTLFIEPIWIDPLFNTFTPIQNKELEAKILDLANKSGIEGSFVFQVDKSSQTSKINAYVTGIGSSKRIVFWDTTLQAMSQDEILFVTGHEMGHYVLNHVWKNFAIYSIYLVLLFYFVDRFSAFLFKRCHFFKSIKTFHSNAALALLLFSFNLASFFSQPIFNGMSRYFEKQADQFGLEITQNSCAAASAFITLQNSNLANPRPGKFYNFWIASHPSLYDRVSFANQYCPWRDKKPLKYEHLFKKGAFSLDNTCK